MKFTPTIGLILFCFVSCLRIDAQTYAVTTFAGQSGIGSADGTGNAARFFNLLGVATDGAGNVFVADTYNHTIRKITPAGVVSTFVGLTGIHGSTDGTGGMARVYFPMNLAVDSAGNIFVADWGNNTIRKITSAGVVSTIAGLAGRTGSADGAGSVARFNRPSGVTVDSAGNVFVADTYNNTIRKITPAGVVSTIAGLAGTAGSADGAGSAARFDSPQAVAVDNAGNVFVSDTYNHTIRRIAPDGSVSTLAGLAGSSGSSNGTGSTARFYGAMGLAADNAGNVFVADTGNHTIRRITSTGVVSTVAGLAGSVGSSDGTGSTARFCSPASVSVDGPGNIYVADGSNYLVRVISPAGVVTTLAGSSGNGSADGIGTGVRFLKPTYLASDGAGNIYLSDNKNATVRKITRDGLVSTLAGLPGSRGYTDGIGSAARFSSPEGIAVDTAGNVYVANYGYGTIRKITPDGTVSTLAGLAGNYGSTDGLGSAARFAGPEGLAVDGAGNLYVADSDNHTIRKITPSGLVSTFAGSAGTEGSTDGTGNAARFDHPEGVAVDNAGNIYVADWGSQTIRKITPGAVVTTLAGLAGSSGSIDGTGSSARFGNPRGVAVDAAGNVFVADNLDSVIRKISPGGVVTTIGGISTNFGSADGLGSAAQFYQPAGVAVDSDGTVYVGETGSSTIRRLVPTGNASPTSGLSALSVRADIVAGQRLIVGFVMSGGPKQVLMRAIGASMQPYLPAGSITAGDPFLELYDDQSRLVNSNDNWGGSPALIAAATNVGAFPLSSSSLDAVLLPAINGLCSAHFTAVTTGTGLMEAYDVAGGLSPRLTAVSARYRVSDGALIAGFSIGGTGLKTLLIRGVGPGLAEWLGASALPDPKLEVWNSANQKIAENDNWTTSLSTAFTSVNDFPLTAGSKDAAVLVTVAAPGVYSAVVSSANGGSGEALVEVYEVP